MQKNLQPLIKLEEMTWHEVAAYLDDKQGIILPTGSIEQHGPIGLIGTDAICAREIAWRAASTVGALVAPEVSYAPAPFNMHFAGTVSISETTYQALVVDILQSLASHGFRKIYLLNGHGANIAPLTSAAQLIEGAEIRLRSWWDFAEVNQLRQAYFGDWEGMHATPSEVSITQATHREISATDLAAPRKLSADYIKAHAGDRHGPPDEHKRDFPDGRVGSKSELAAPAYGRDLLEAATQAVADDYNTFLRE